MKSSLATLAFLAAALLTTDSAKAAGPEDTLYMDLKDGRVVIEMLPQYAPQHVARIKELVRSGFYDGLLFHRVIPGFMAQTGDPRGDGTGGSGHKLEAEFSQAPFLRGTVGMARSSSPDSGDSQFFIMFAPAPHLNGQYTVWGRVVDGMEHVDAIKSGDQSRNGAVSDPDKIIKMQMAADAAS
ncbi:MAG: peptidylprolyl isomerase [Rhodospirillales bacterium]|nr:peptidylprolyl isomerase [Rhodospirillales bacterium]